MCYLLVEVVCVYVKYFHGYERWNCQVKLTNNLATILHNYFDPIYALNHH